MVLVIDAGNSRIKAAVFEQTSLVSQSVITDGDFYEGVKNILDTFPITDIVGAFVGKSSVAEIFSFSERVKISVIDRNFHFPFVNRYATPETLGIDRMVLVAGAVLRFPTANRLIIDAGTCITYDYVDRDDIYYGGAISPGIQLRYKALNDYTANLPSLAAQIPKSITGDSTNESIHSGVVNGAVLEIDGFIDQYRIINPNIIIILTGGDAVFLANRLKNTIFANSNFLLESLNQTHQYKLQND